MVQKKSTKRYALAKAKMSPKAKQKVKKAKQIQGRQEFRESKRQARAATSKPIPKRDELAELKSVDQLFASMGDEDDGPIRDDDASSDAGSDSSAGAFHEVDGSGDEAPSRSVKVGDLAEEQGDDADDTEAGKRHAQELKLIKQKDPEFYEFLMKEDRALLDFSMGDESDVGDEEGEGDEEDGGKPAAKAKAQPGRLLDLERLERIHSSTKESFTACRAAVNAYHMAVRSIEVTKPRDPFAEKEEDEEQGGKRGKKKTSAQAKRRQEKSLLRIEDEAVFSEAIEWSIAHLLGALKHHAGEVVGDDSKRKGKKDSKAAKEDKEDDKAGKAGLMDPTKCKRWSRVKVITNIFWDETFILLSHLTDNQMLEYVLRHCSTPEALSWLWPYRQLRQKFIRRCCALWSQSKAQNVRVLAFLFLRNCGVMVLQHPDSLSSASQQLQALLKMVLQAFADCAAGGYSWKSLSRFRFMENCMVELLRLEDSTSYRMGYVCVRQLAKILRDACISISLGAVSMKVSVAKGGEKQGKKRRAAQQNANSLVTWAFVRSLYLWTKAVGAIPALKPLAYPLSMIILGAIKNKLPALQHFPFVYHCLLSLNRLGSSLEAFVPVCSHLLKATGMLVQATEKAQRTRGARTAQEAKEKKTLDANVKAPELDVLIKFTEAQISEVLALETVGTGITFLFLDHLGLLSQSPAFPEIISPVMIHLRKYCKSCRSEVLRRQLKSVVDKAEASAIEVRTRREALHAVPDAKQFLLFEPDTPIGKARAEALKRRLKEEQDRVEAELREEEKDKQGLKDEAEAGKKKKEKRKNEEETEPEESKRQKKTRKKEKAPKKTPQELAAEAVDKAVAAGDVPERDEVEDMGFSSGSDAAEDDE